MVAHSERIREADDLNAQHDSKKYSYENKRLIWDSFQIGIFM